MRKVRLWSTSIITVVFLNILIACTPAKYYEYDFMQRKEDITSIEIVYADPYSISVDYKALQPDWIIDRTLWGEFIDDLGEIPCKRYRLDPPNNISYNVFRITYSDGSCELFSKHSMLQIDAKGEMAYTLYYFEGDGFDQLLNKYQRLGDDSLS